MGTGQFGMLYESSAIKFEDLTEYTRSEVEKLIRLQTSDEKRVQSCMARYKADLAKTRRLHLRSSHSRYAVCTIDHFRFLVSIGCEITSVKHVVLFASMSDESQRLHPYRTSVQRMLEAREDMQREKACLAALESRTRDQETRLHLLTTLAFLAKIR